MDIASIGNSFGGVGVGVRGDGGIGEGVGVGGGITGDAPHASFTATVASFVTSGEYAAPVASRCALFVSVSA
jgi:hypothetical protein